MGYQHTIRWIRRDEKTVLQERVESINYESNPEYVWVDVPVTDEQDDGYRES